MILHHGTANISQCLVFRYYGISLFTIVGTDRAQVQPIINYLVLNDIFAILHIWINISLGALAPNSRDRHEKLWRPDFTHHKTHPKMHFVCKKQTEVHF